MALVGVTNSYVFQITSSGGDELLKTYQDMIEFHITFEGGVEFPKVEISLLTGDEQAIRKIREDDFLYFMIGSIDYPERIYKVYPRYSAYGKAGQYLKMNIKGFIVDYASTDPISYYAQSRIRHFKDKGSIEVLEEVMNEYNFTVHNVDKLKGNEQVWINPNHTDYRFIRHLLKHTYIDDDDTVLYGFDMKANFKLIKLSTAVSQGQKLKLVFGEEQGGTKTYNLYDIENKNEFGLMNSFVGYHPIYKEIDLKEGDYVEEDEEEKPITEKLAPKLAMRYDYERFDHVYFFDEDNIHEDYYKAYFINKRLLAQMNTSRIFVVTSNKYIPDVDLFDIVYFQDIKVNNNDDEYLTGKYLVKAITLSYEGGSYTQKFTLTRDNFNVLY